MKPTIFEALTLVFGFQLPAPEVVINTASGIQYFNARGQPSQNLFICVNCESVLTNLYKVFLLFTELSNGKESFILKNSIISGRLEKEEEVIPLDRHNQEIYTGNLFPNHSAKASFPQSSSSQVPSHSLSTIRRELTSEVIAEMYVSNNSSVTITPIITTANTATTPIVQPQKPIQVSNHSNKKPQQKPMPTLMRAKKPLPLSKDGAGVEVITLDEEDNSNPFSSKQILLQRPGQGQGKYAFNIENSMN